MSTMAGFTFRCVECGARYAEDEVLYQCPECRQRQQPGGPARGVLAVDVDGVPSGWPGHGRSVGAWVRSFLPVAESGPLDAWPVGETPLLPVPRLREALSMPGLWLKDDTRNPSGSTKDRASWLVAAKALEYGFHTVAAASTGNAATALAAAAAAAGLRSVVLVPADAPRAKLVQMAAYGAALVPVAGTYDDAFELSLSACERFGWYNRNTASNPFTIEGKKTAALEIAAALQPASADVVVVPAGDGVIAAGLAKGFGDLVRAGLAGRVPRIVLVQPEGSAALARAIRTGRDEIEAVPGAASVADSLVVSSPRNAVLCLREVRASGGGAVIVGDEAIVAAIARLAGLAGVFAEPAAAAALAGLERALAEGLVDRDERCVLMVTGTGLKDVAAASRAVRIPDPVPADLDAVAAQVAAGSG